MVDINTINIGTAGMTIERMVRYLDTIEANYMDKPTFTGEVIISSMAHDCKEAIKTLTECYNELYQNYNQLVEASRVTTTSSYCTAPIPSSNMEGTGNLTI